MKKLSFILALLIGCNLVSTAQLADPRNAKEFFKKTNYLMAMKEYAKLLKIDRDKLEYNYNMGICYLRTNVDRPKALYYFQKVYKDPKHPTETPYFLGKSYMLNLKFDQAKKHLEEYIAKPGNYKVDAQLLLESCESAKELMKQPVNVSFKNLGRNINSEYPDYNPFVTKDEKNIVFTSRRAAGKGSLEFDGYYGSDIYQVKFNGTNFTKAKNIGSVNTALDEEVIGIYDDGSKIFVYLDHNLGGKDDPYGDIYTSVQKGSSYSKRTKIDNKEINTSHMEISCSISSDGKTMLFSSNRPNDSKGGYDIYMIRMLPSGEWSKAQNVSAINTNGDEEHPTLAPDGKTMYFSSTGHPGMGGMDLFKATWNPETNEWEKPTNLGYPVNTPDDENTICFPADYKHAYISACRPEGFGGLDIYRITFNDVLLNPALFIVNLKDITSGEMVKEGYMTVFNEDDEIIAEFKPSKSGVFTITLDPGKYNLEIEAPGYPLKVQKMVVSEFDYKEGAILKNFSMGDPPQE